MYDEVSKPEHYNKYNDFGIECWDVCGIVAKDAPDGEAGGLIWNVQKYIWRCWYKGHTLKDLRKARAFLDRLIKYLEELEATQKQTDALKHLEKLASGREMV